MIDTFRDSLVANSCVVHGPFAPADAVSGVVERIAELAGGRDVAVATGDPLIAALGLVAALRARDVAVLEPDDATWATRLPDAAVGLTGSVVAIADRGSCAIACGPGAPRGASLLPRTHLCVVRSSTVVPSLFEAIERIRADELPSALIWVGGPSRTGDLEMVITLGVHGPGHVEVVIVDDRD